MATIDPLIKCAPVRQAIDSGASAIEVGRVAWDIARLGVAKADKHAVLVAELKRRVMLLDVAERKHMDDMIPVWQAKVNNQLEILGTKLIEARK